jgi:hypothetical protein
MPRQSVEIIRASLDIVVRVFLFTIRGMLYAVLYAILALTILSFVATIVALIVLNA